MNNRNVAACLLAVAALFAAVPALSASDPRKSHRSIGSAESFDEQELAQRLQDAQDLSALINLADKIRKNPGKFPKVGVSDPLRKALLERFLNDPDKQKLLKDRRVQELFRDAMKNQKLSDKQLQDLGKQLDQISPEDLRKLADEASKHPGDFKLDDQDREALRKIADQWKAGQKPADLDKLRDIFNKVGQNPHLPPDDLDALKRTLPALPPPIEVPAPIEPPAEKDPMNPAAVPAIPDPPPSNRPPPPPADAEDTTSETLQIVADFFQDIDPDSELLGKVADLLRDVANDDSGGTKWAKGAISSTADWVGSMNPGDWLPSDETKQAASSWFGKFSMPSAPKMGGVPSMPSASGGLPSGSSTLEMESLAHFFVWGGALAALGFAGWRLLLWYKGGNGAGNGLAARWPVRPGAVATRGDLVRAFEYLALLMLGVDAKHRHHLDLAQRLGNPSPEPNDARRQAANHLAYLYELARYAPEDESLPEAELAAARRDLSFLAGAGAA